MAKSATLLILALSVSLSTSFRVAVNSHVAKAAVDQQNAQLAAFIAATQMSTCKDCKGMLIGNIVEGLSKRGFIENVEFASGDMLLTVTLNVERAYGQIATASRVPVLWVVDRQLTAQISRSGDDTTVKLTGLHTDVPRQGMQTYETILQAQIVNTSWGKPVLFKGPGTLMSQAENYASHCGGSGDCDTYLENERKATSNWLYFNSKDFTKQSRKISKIVKTAIGFKMISWDNWGSILYSMISSTGKSIDELVYDKNGGVIARASLWEGAQSNADAVKYSLLPKAQKIGTKAITNCPSMLASTVASSAKSGWGFGMLFAHGDPVVAPAMSSYGKADPNKLVNLFSLCEKGAHDADPECGGSDYGRVHWTDSVPADYQ